MIDLPPPQYHYSGGLVVIERPAQTVMQICHLMGLRAPGRIYGCMVPGLMACMIVVPKVDAATTQQIHDDVVRHELAHCAGWRHE